MKEGSERKEGEGGREGGREGGMLEVGLESMERKRPR